MPVVALDLAVAGLVFLPLGVLLLRSRPFPGAVVAFVVGVPALAGLMSVAKAPMRASFNIRRVCEARTSRWWRSPADAWANSSGSGIVDQRK